MTSQPFGSAFTFTGLPITLFIVLGFVFSLTGCGAENTASMAPDDPPSVSIPPLPDEYRTLAESCAWEMKSAPDQFRDDPTITETMAEIHSALFSLQGIQSADQEIMYIAAQSESAISEFLLHFERFNALPNPPGFAESFVGGFVNGFFFNVPGIIDDFQYLNELEDAYIAELQPMIAADEKLDALHQTLPIVAEKYSATFSDSTDRIVVDFDESWAWFGPNDRFSIDNRGPALEDCTIVVQLTGASGEVRNNVHFVRHWPANSSMYGRCEAGAEILEQQVGRRTVTNVQKVDVTIYSPNFATQIEYIYQGAEKDKDIAERCEDLEFTGRYLPFESGILWNTERRVRFTLEGVEGIPKCRVNLTFRNGSQSKSWHYSYDNWMQDDTKTFRTPKGELTFDPTAIDVSISFPGTSYTHDFTFTVNH